MVTPVWQVVGYQNSGKTTFILSIIRYLKERGLQTAVLKHHGHGGTPDRTAMKDTDKYYHTGAAAALVEGEGVLQLQGNMEENTVHKSLALLMAFEPDLIILEGYKKESYPKIVMIREEGDLSLFQELTNCQAAILWPGVSLSHDMRPVDLSVFSLGQDRSIFEWMLEKIADYKEA